MISDLVPARRGRSAGVPGFAVAVAAVCVAALAMLVIPTKLAVALLLGAVLVLVAATRVDLAVAIFVFVIFTEAAHVAILQSGFSLLAELVTGLVLLAHLGDRRAAGTRSGLARVLLLVVPFALWTLTSFFWAAVPGIVLGEFVNDVRYVGIAVVLVAAIRTERTFRFAAWGIIAGGAFLGVVAVLQVLLRTGPAFFFGFGIVDVQGLGTGVTGARVVGPLGDPNFFAQRMLIVLPFAIERAVNDRRPLLRVFAVATALVTLVTIVLTFSRGGALAAGLLLLGCLFHFLPVRRALLLLAVGAAAALVFVPSTYVDRVLALRGIASVETTTETSVRGRTSSLLVGLQMFEDHPLGGVGTMQYPVHYGDYAKAVSLDPSLARAPHNLYIQVLSENGIVGALLFGLMVGGAIVSARSAVRRLREVDRPVVADMVWAVYAALLGYLVAALFLHLAYPRMFYVLIAMCVAGPFLVRFEPDRTEEARPHGDRRVAVVDA